MCDSLSISYIVLQNVEYAICVCDFRFWASVEPYCADITNEEIRVLEELLKPPEDEAEYYKAQFLFFETIAPFVQHNILFGNT